MFGEHFGRVYVSKKDIVDGQTLEAGDVVSFYLYADRIGLGAESCRVERKGAETVLPIAEVSRTRAMRADAVEFVPGDASAKETAQLTKLRADAAEFVPSHPSTVALSSSP